MREMTCRTDGAMRVEATDGTVTTWMDEPERMGGDGTAPTPMQTLLAALGGCTAITLKLYSARKEWPLEDVEVRVTMEDGEKGGPNRWTQHVTLKGDLDAEQRERLMQIAGRCPVHRALEGGNTFEETEVEPAGGRSAMGFPDASRILEVFDNPAPARDYEIRHTAHEFTSLCPVTGQPDFATLTFRYVADAKCVELKSLKLYLQAFRNEGVFYEALVNRLLEDLVGVLEPRSLEIVGEFSVRGGMSSVITARYPDPA